MKTLRYKLDNSFVPAETRIKTEKEHKNQFISLMVDFLRLGYKDGLTRHQNRNLENIIDKIEEAKGPTIEIEDAEFDMFWFLVIEDKIKTDPQSVRIMNKLYDALEECKESKHKKDKGEDNEPVPTVVSKGKPKKA